MERCTHFLQEQKSSKFITEKLLISNVLNIYDLEPKESMEKVFKNLYPKNILQCLCEM